MPVESDADLLGMFDAGEFGAAATWTPAAARGLPYSNVALTVIEDDPTAGGFNATARQVEVMVPLPALPAEPQRNDTMTVAGAPYRVDAATSDIDRRVWRLTLVTG